MADVNDKLIGRITCDIDTRDFRAIIRCLKVFRRYGFTKHLLVKDSPSKTGYHVVCWNEDAGFPKEKLIKIRLKAGDDKMRCRLDSRTGRQIQVLFTRKTKRVFK